MKSFGYDVYMNSAMSIKFDRLNSLNPPNSVKKIKFNKFIRLRPQFAFLIIKKKKTKACVA